MKIIAVTGGSGCGKTFFTNLLFERLQKKTAVLPLDFYYKDRPDQIPNDKYDFDSPQAFDFDLYNQHLNLLNSGESVQMPIFGYETGKRESGFTDKQIREISVTRDGKLVHVWDFLEQEKLRQKKEALAKQKFVQRERYLTVMDITDELESSETRELDALKDRSIFMGAEEK